MSKGVKNIDSVRYARKRLEDLQKDFELTKSRMLQYRLENQNLSSKVDYLNERLSDFGLKNGSLNYRIKKHSTNYNSLPAIVRFFVPKSIRKV